MKWIIHLLFSFSLLSAFASNDFDSGIDAYHSKEYDKAISFFEKATEASPRDASAYFNIGLCYHELGQYGKAIWAFEKVLKYAPNDSDAREKINRSYSKLYPGETWPSHLNRLESALFGFPPDTWSTMTIVFSILVALCIIAFVKAQQISGKRLSIILGFVFSCFLIVSLIVAYNADKYDVQTDYAIVTKKAIPTFTPNKMKMDYTIREGERVYLNNYGEDSTYCSVQQGSGTNYLVKIEDFDLI